MFSAPSRPEAMAVIIRELGKKALSAVFHGAQVWEVRYIQEGEEDVYGADDCSAGK